MPIEPLAGLRQADPPGRAVQQPGAEMLLKLLHLLADDSPWQVQATTGRSETALLHHMREHFEGTQTIHARRHSLSLIRRQSALLPLVYQTIDRAVPCTHLALAEEIDMNRLADRVALVTGGSRGIGAAIAKRLAQHGADVALTYERAEDRAQAVVAEIRAAGRRGIAIAADSSDPQAVSDSVERTAREFGRFDILVNNAGIFPSGPPEAVTLEELDRTLAVHVRAVFVAAQAASRHLQHGGRIISIGSCFAERVPYAGVSLYAMSKAALVGLTRGLARDFGPRGITVNVVHPGSTDTEMNPADGPAAEEERRYIALGRYARPEEIAATVAHLASEEAHYVTGASIAVDGGFAA